MLDRSIRGVAAVVTGWVALALCGASAAHAVEAVVLNDSYIQSNMVNANYGAAGKLRVQGAPGNATVVQKSFLQFDLSALPSGTTGSEVAQATLIVFVNKITANGTVEVHRVSTGAINNWNEST